MRLISKIRNQKNHRIIKKYTAGIILTGDEIKSLRSRQVSLEGSFIFPQKQELYVINMHIAPYKNAYLNLVQKKSNARCQRKLLLKKNEIANLIHQSKVKCYIIIPLQIFINEKGWAKLEIALTQHLKNFQVKSEEKEKEIRRKLQRKEYN